MDCVHHHLYVHLWKCCGHRIGKSHSLKKISNMAHVIIVIKLGWILNNLHPRVSPCTNRHHATVSIALSLICKLFCVGLWWPRACEHGFSDMCPSTGVDAHKRCSLHDQEVFGRGLYASTRLRSLLQWNLFAVIQLGLDQKSPVFRSQHTHVRSTLGSDSNIREFLLLMLRLYTQKLLSNYGDVQGTMPAELSIDVGLMNNWRIRFEYESLTGTRINGTLQHTWWFNLVSIKPCTQRSTHTKEFKAWRNMEVCICEWENAPWTAQTLPEALRQSWSLEVLACFTDSSPGTSKRSA